MSPNEEIYLNCGRITIMVCWYIFGENAYYFFMGCLKGYGYLKNTTIATFVMFFVLSPSFIYILAFRCKMGVKGIWESTSLSMTLGDILFVYWVFSFDLIKIKELANQRLNADNKNIKNSNDNNEKELFLNKIENSETNVNKNIGINSENKKTNNNIEMNYIDS